MNTWITFPDLGIEPFMLRRIAFSFTLFGKEITVAWYGILIVIGMIGAFIYACKRAKHGGVKVDTMIDYALWTIVIAIICARLYYVIFYSNGEYKTFYDVIAIWNGGLAIYGGIIGGGVTVFVVSKIKKQNFFAMADYIAPGVMIGQMIGRWGNFVNGEAHGTVTSLPWRMGVITTYSTEIPAVSAFTCYHPTFLYESLWNLIGFILINIFYKKHRFNGEVFLWYVAWYGFGRGFIELLRTDSLMIGSLRVSALVGFVSFVAATVALIVIPIVRKKAEKATDNDVKNIADTEVIADSEVIGEAPEEKYESAVTETELEKEEKDESDK